MAKARAVDRVGWGPAGTEDGRRRLVVFLSAFRSVGVAAVGRKGLVDEVAAGGRSEREAHIAVERHPNAIPGEAGIIQQQEMYTLQTLLTYDFLYNITKTMM
jgi:hypothetical protein